jgi:hypothetical protein
VAHSVAGRLGPRRRLGGPHTKRPTTPLSFALFDKSPEPELRPLVTPTAQVATPARPTR